MGIGHGGDLIKKVWAILLIFCAAFALANTAFASENSNNTILNETNSTLDPPVTYTASVGEDNLSLSLDGNNSNLDQQIAETNTTNNSNKQENDNSVDQSSNNDSIAAGTENSYNNMHGIWIQSSDVNQLNIQELINAGITDIFVKTNLISQPTYDTVLKTVLKMVERKGINVHAWITCFKDENGKWVDPQGMYTYQVKVAYTVPVKKAYIAYYYKKWYKAYYKVKVKKWYRSSGKWKYYWKLITKYKWKYSMTPYYKYKTVNQTKYKSETRTDYDKTYNNKLIEAIADITTNYNIAGIHLDYVRYPGTANKYSGSTSAITNFVHTVYDTVKNIKPKVAVSAALMPEGSENAKYYGQDYSQLSQYLDFLVPMMYKGNYGKTTAWVGTTTKYIVSHANGKPVIVGLQTYESDSNLSKLPLSELMQDTKAATDNGASGYLLFRYGLMDPNFYDPNSSSTEAAGSSSTSTGATTTTNNPVISIADIKNAANSVKTFIETNHRLPTYVTITNQQIELPAFLKLLVSSVISINNKSTAPITLKDYQDPSNPSQTLKSGNITLAEYLKMAKSISSYMDSNGEAPNYATSSLGNVQYESIVYMYSKILNFVKTNNYLVMPKRPSFFLFMYIKKLITIILITVGRLSF